MEKSRQIVEDDLLAQKMNKLKSSNNRKYIQQWWIIQ
ncbi:unnamed protein product [Paramecium sonneborni]|uniref:Uncharacterized protein n=1 Tax=Paramecium sonneborni TaxID=65129 RepID=A0A8S1RTC0_9CILI|nr:unnamed protein product [Paramecium sonneborni]